MKQIAMSARREILAIIFDAADEHQLATLVQRIAYGEFMANDLMVSH